MEELRTALKSDGVDEQCEEYAFDTAIDVDAELSNENAHQQRSGDATKHDDIGAAIAKTDKMTAVGRVTFDPATHLTVQDNEHVPIQFYQIQDGKRVMFYPPQYKTGDFTQPSWMK